MNTETLVAFLGWSLVINLGLYLFSVICLITMRGLVTGIHAKMFGVKEEELPMIYFRYIAHYKIALIVFNLVPYVAMKIVAG